LPERFAARAKGIEFGSVNVAWALQPDITSPDLVPMDHDRLRRLFRWLRRLVRVTGEWRLAEVACLVKP